MSVINNQDVEASVVNSAFVSRTSDSSTIGVLALQNTTNPNSGPAIANIQRAANKSFETMGIAGEADPLALNYASNERIADNDTLKQAIEKLDQAFNDLTGHNHQGAGQGGPVSAQGLSDLNYFRAAYQTVNVPAYSGTSLNVTSLFTSETPGGDTVTEGVITTPPFNEVIMYLEDGTQLEDSSGRKVYGRLTFASLVWTLSTYVKISGVETAFNVTPATDFDIFYRKVYTLGNLPTIEPTPVLGSVDISGDVPDATATQRGLVSSGSQSFGGAKAFVGNLLAQSRFLGDEFIDSTTAGPIATFSAPAKTILRYTNNGIFQIDAITGGTANQFLVVYNASNDDASVTHSAGANGFRCPGSQSFTLVARTAFWCYFDSTSSRWVVMGGGGSGGANQSLSNLTNPTNVNQNLEPQTDNTFFIGSSVKRWAQGFFRSVLAVGSTGNLLAANHKILAATGEEAYKVEAEASNAISGTNAMVVNGPIAAAFALGYKDLVVRTRGDASESGNLWLGTDTTAGLRGYVGLAGRSLRLPRLAADPATPLDGFTYYNTTTNRIRFYNGTIWQDVGASTSVSTITTSQSLSVATTVYIVNAASGNVTLTVPTGTQFTYKIKRIDSSANFVRIITSSGQIDNANEYYLTRGQAIDVVADGTNAWVF
jgi:hypothetical protein